MAKKLILFSYNLKQLNFIAVYSCYNIRGESKAGVMGSSLVLWFAKNTTKSRLTVVSREAKKEQSESPKTKHATNYFKISF